MFLIRHKKEILFFVLVFLAGTSVLHSDNVDKNKDISNGPGTGNPFADIEEMENEMERRMQDSFERFDALLQSGGILEDNTLSDKDFDLVERENEYVIELNAEELNKEKIDIEANERSITVSGEYSAEEETRSPDTFIRSQKFSSFVKTIPTPEDANTRGMRSEQNGDLLIISIPKK